MRDWEERNRDKRREYNREKTRTWRAANLEKERQRARKYARKWRKDNPDRFLAAQRSRRAEKHDSLLQQRRAREGHMPRDKYLTLVRRSSRGPKKRGRPAGRVSKEMDGRITVIADCMLRGMNVWKLAPEAYPQQNYRDAAFRAAQKFVLRNAAAISHRKDHLSSLPQSEREDLVATAANFISA